MARKSRKGLAEPEIQEERKVYQTAVYVRLSIENSGKADDGISFENQKRICLDYIKTHPDLKLFDLYEDNGEKGTNMDRPEFQRMMDDVKSGRVNCVIVKDLSRFSRDYIDAGNYLEKIFPFLGVRFISITDSYDSISADGDEKALMVPLKNMINAAYAKDISRKVITSFRTRQAKCEILPSFGPYGYVKSKKNPYRYELDEKTAPFVKQIFEDVLAGTPMKEIIRKLNECGAITPAARKLELGIWHDEKHSKTHWNNKTITDMLRNPTYTGCIVYGRMETSLADGIPWHRTDRSNWHIFPNMHEAIVSREQYEQVQKILKEKSDIHAVRLKAAKKKLGKLINLYEGKIFCGDCGKRMRFLKQYISSQNCYNLKYACGGYLDSRNKECTRHSISMAEVNDAIQAAIQEQMLFLDKCEEVNRIAGKKKDELLRRKMVFMKKELEAVSAEKNSLFEEYVECKLTRDEYDLRRKELNTHEKRLERELRNGKKREREHDQVLSGMNGWVQAVKKAGEGNKITKELVEELVDRVLIFEDKRVEIFFRFVEEREELERLMVELVEEEKSKAEGKLESEKGQYDPAFEVRDEGADFVDLSAEGEAGSSGWV